MMYRLLPLLLLLTTGCTNYHYDIAISGANGVAPGGNGGPQVLKDQDLVVPAAPAELHLRQVSNRCVVLVSNRTAQPIYLDGGGSAIVDPTGQSRAIASQLIAGGSFIKLILPPVRDPDPSGPRVGLGLGVIVDASVTRTPQYLDVNPPGQEYWDWDGNGSVTLILTLKQNDQTTRHEYIIHRAEK